MIGRHIHRFFAVFAFGIFVSVTVSTASGLPMGEVELAAAEDGVVKSVPSKPLQIKNRLMLAKRERPLVREPSNRVYRISPGDRLSVQFYQRDELSGERIVRADGHIFLPLLGSLRAAGLTRVELEKRILAAFEEEVERTILVSVDVIEYRPIYVVGDVNRPGTVPYRPGLTPVQILALSGGVLRSRLQPGQSNPIDVMREQQRAQVTLENVKRGLARLARLKAEQSLTFKLVPEPQLIQLIGFAQAQSATNQELKSLMQNRQWYTKQTVDLKKSIRLIEKQLDAQKLKLKSVKSAMEAQQNEKNEVSNLLSRKLAVRRQLYERTYALSSAKKEINEANVEIAQAQLMLFERKRELDNYWPTQNRRLEREIMATRVQIKEHRLGLQTSQTIIAQMGAVPIGVRPAALASPSIAYSVMRFDTGFFQPLRPETERADIMPGDVLRITLGNPEPVTGGSSEMLTSKAESEPRTPPVRHGDRSSLRRLAPSMNQASPLDEAPQDPIISRNIPPQPDGKIGSEPPLSKSESSAKEDDAENKRIASIDKPDRDRLNEIKSGIMVTNAAVPTKEPRPEPEAKQKGLSLLAKLQTELRRVGCYRGKIDGVWGVASRSAIRRFNRRSGRQLAPWSPKPSYYDILIKAKKTTCKRVYSRYRNKNGFPLSY